MNPWRRNRFSAGAVQRGLAVLAVAWILGTGMICGRAATGGDYLIDVITGEKGLPNSSVTAIAQTPDGYLWVGTYDGLARFDGERFVKFSPENTPALRNARIRRLAVTGDGALWISTHDGAISAYRDGRFTLEWAGEGVADAAPLLVAGRSNRPVFLLRLGELIRWSPEAGSNRWETFRSPGASAGMLVAEDAAGTIWCSGRDNKLYRFGGSRFEAVPGNGGMAGTAVTALTADAAGRIWAGTEQGIWRWETDGFQNQTPTNAEPVVHVRFLRVLPGGEVWCVGNDRVRMARGRQWERELLEARDLFTGWRDRTGLHADGKGGRWLYDYGRGLFHIRADGRVRQLTLEENFPGERVDAFLEDREGNIWAGVDRGGLVRVREKRFSVLAPGDGEAARAAVTVMEDPAGAIWVGTFGGGLHRWFNQQWQAYTVPGGTRRGFVFSAYPESADSLWVSAGEEDLYFGQGGKFTLFNPAVHAVKVLLRARDGRLWIGTKSGLGVVSRGQFRQFYPDDGVARTEVRALAEDAAGVIWAGAGDGTLYRIGSNLVTTFRPPEAWGNLPIWALLADQDGVVWVGTSRGGLLRFAAGRFARLTKREGLPDDVICQILDDGAGRLWVGSKQGIFNAEKSELHAVAARQRSVVNCTAYGRYDGLPSLECSDSYQPAAWRTQDGRLLFATLGGVVAVRPGEVGVNPLPPPVVIERATVDGREQPPVRRLMPRKGMTAEWELIVPPGKQQVRIEFTGLSFVSPDRVRFKYKLEGLAREWSEPGSARAAEFNFLPPGSYQFHVLACNNDAVWNETGAVLGVVVQPRFTDTWLFHLLVWLGAVSAVVVAVRRVYVRRYRRKLELVQRQRAVEQDRARIAKDIHDDLGAGLTHIALLSELARRDAPSEMPQHVANISDMARELTRNMDEIVWAVDPQNDTLEGLVTYVSKFAQEYLSVAQVRCRLDVPPQLPPLLVPAEVRHNLFLALKEAFHNVVKHARATEVWLRVSPQPGGFSLVVEDNGCGMTPGQSSAGQRDRFSSGRGLSNMEKRLATAGGKFQLHSRPGQGTRLEFTVDLTARRSPEVATDTPNAN